MQLRNSILPIAILISLFIYYPTYEYGLVTDYLGWLNKYRDGNWQDIWHCFHYPGLHQFFHLVNYTIFKITNADGFMLYLIFSVSHGLVAYSVYLFLRKYGEWMDWKEAGTISFFTAFMFLVSPYQIEAVTWKACYHYLMVTGLTSLGGLSLINYLRGWGSRYLVSHLLCFGLSLFTIELGLVTPGIYAALYLYYYWFHTDRKVLTNGLKISVLHAVALVGYFLMTKAMIGDYIGHYGADKHMVFTPSVLISTAAKYWSKYMIYSHYFPYQLRYDWYQLLSKPLMGMIFILPLLFALVYGIWKGKTNKNKLILSFAIFCFLIGLLPVLNLYFMNLHFYENDRYGYFASPYFYLGLVVLIYILLPRIKYSVSLLFIVLSCFFTYKTIKTVSLAGETISALVEDFKWYDAEHLVVAGLPENFNGVYMFRDFSDEGVALIESLEWKGRKIYEGEIKSLSKFNMKGEGKHLDVKFIGKDTLQVWDIMPGSWFWRKGVGMGSYENNGVKIDMRDGHFHATFDTVHPGTKFIIPEGKNWVELPR